MRGRLPFRQIEHIFVHILHQLLQFEEHIDSVLAVVEDLSRNSQEINR